MSDRRVPGPTGTLPVADPATLRLDRVVDSTDAEGPGRRTAVWVQGCTVRCPGCFNPHLWAVNGGQSSTPADLARRVLGNDTQGVTLLGGEPFDQAAPLAVLAAAVRAAGRSVMTFTGYTLEVLQAAAERRPDVGDLLAATDLLVDGPYLQGHPDTTRPWLGSTNQGVHFLTSRYRHLADHLPAQVDRVEIRVLADGRVAVNGWATREDLDDLLTGL